MPSQKRTRNPQKSYMATNFKEVLKDNANAPDDDLVKPNLLEIKNLVIEVQMSLASAITEDQAIRKEIEDLKSSVKFNKMHTHPQKVL